jgi:hypothetical protein
MLPKKSLSGYQKRKKRNMKINWLNRKRVLYIRYVNEVEGKESDPTHDDGQQDHDREHDHNLNVEDGVSEDVQCTKI